MEESNVLNQDKSEQTKLCNEEKDQPTNLLENFSPEKNLKETQNSNLSQPDLNLRLSLGSIYSESPKENPLTRSSSIAGIVSLTKNSDELERRFLSSERARSLPTGSNQEQRLITLRELQTMRRIEAKKRLIQKHRSFKEDKRKEKFPVPEPMPSLPSEVAAWPTSSEAKSQALCRAILKIKSQGLSPKKRGVEGSATSYEPSRYPAGVEDSSAPRTQRSFKLPFVTKNAEPVVATATTSNGILVKSSEINSENPYRKARSYCGNFEDNGMDVMRQMPSVSTTGEGPNGRRVEGFLCTFMRGHVCIVCVCHGSFFSPAEFVKHANGKDVANPMKHITVHSTFA